MEIFLSPRYWILILAISLVGTSANVANYYLGQRGSGAVFERYPELEASDSWGKVNGWFQRWGSRTLALSPIPLLGTALAAAAGIFGVRMAIFLIYVIIGKILRNWVLLAVTLGLFGTASG